MYNLIYAGIAITIKFPIFKRHNPTKDSSKLNISNWVSSTAVTFFYPSCLICQTIVGWPYTQIGMKFSWLATTQEELFICFSINLFYPLFFLEGSRESVFQGPIECQLKLVIIGDFMQTYFHWEGSSISLGRRKSKKSKQIQTDFCVIQ